MESSKSEPALGTDKKARSSMARAGGAAKRASTVVKLSKGGKKKSMIKKGVAASSNRLASGQSSVVSRLPVYSFRLACLILQPRPMLRRLRHESSRLRLH